MLDIDKSTVDFLVTENMVQEVEKVLSHDVPLVHAIVEEMVKRDIDRIYFVACGSPLNAAQTAKHLDAAWLHDSGQGRYLQHCR